MSRSSIEPPVRVTPDFSRQALAQLLDEAKLLQQVSRDATTNNDQPSWQQLSAVASRMHAITVLLGRPGAALFVEEIIAVVRHLSQSSDELSEERAHTLLNAIEVFIDYLAYLQWPGANDSVLSALPVLNECRALRDENLLSENLLLAAGIQLPDVSQLAVPSGEELQHITQQIQASRKPLINALLEWYRSPDPTVAMRELSSLLTALAERSQTSTQLSTLTLLFESAAVVADAIASGELETTALVRYQFAQLERMLKRWAALTTHDFPLQSVLTPETAFRNFLYTIATEQLSSPRATSLRRQFDLELFNFKNDAAQKQAFTPARVSAALGQSVRESVSHEIEALQRWLSQAASDPTHGAALDLRSRLSQLEPALAMLDEQQALAHLVVINSGLANMERDASSANAEEKAREWRLEIAQATIKFRRSLDQQHQLPVAGRSQFTEVFEATSQSLGNAKNSGAVALDEHPQYRLLSQAQRQLHSVEHTLEGLYALPTNAVPTSNQKAALHVVRQGLQEIEQVLQILPLPEVSPLLNGMRSFLDYCSVQWPGMQSKRLFAELLVSVDYYLASVLSPHDSASQLLMNSEVIMQQLEHAISAEADDAPLDLDETQVIAISGDALTRLVEQTLEQMTVIGDQLQALSSTAIGSTTEADATQALNSAWQALAEETQDDIAPELYRLANANIDLLKQVASQDVSKVDALPLFQESHAVLPQLMDQHQGHSDHIIGFTTLVNSLRTMASEAAEYAAINPLDIEPSDNEDDSDQVELDNTLQLVFVQECQGHIDALRKSIETAASKPDQRATALPTPAALRALHTLTGTAQTVGEDSIIALTEPLQKIALLRQRNNQVFNASETQFVEEVVDALQARVDALKNGIDASTIAIETEQAVTALAEQMISEPPVFAPEEQSDEHRLSASLKGVFVEEASELLDQMRSSIDQHRAGSIQLITLLNALKSPVHTLKGSARMAGFADFATVVHALEPMLDDGEQADLAQIEKELALLAPMLLPQQGVAPAAEAPAAAASSTSSDDKSSANVTVSETGFSKMMSLSTQASVSQAKLGEQLLRLNEIYRDLDSSTQRLRKQVHNSVHQPTAAEQEMLADLDAARTALASTLQIAETEHLQGSRADAELQQSLIRAQLVNFSECQIRLERAAQDSAQELGVSVALKFSGTTIDLDRSLYRQLLGPLEHVIRNAVAHGIEPAEQRVKANKPEQGKVVLEADFDGNDLVLTIKDDGAGIDVERLNNARVAAGKSQIETGQALRDALCEPGFSTRDNIDEIAGRGMGLAVVDQLAISLGGSLQIASVQGSGTTITLRIPQKVVVNQVVLVRCGRSHYAIPVKHVHTVLAELSDTDTTRVFNGKQYAAHNLSELLGVPNTATSSPSLFIRDKGKSHASILAQSGDSHVALDVDAVVGYREVIAQAIGPQLMGLKRFRGGSVLADGTPVLILDMPRLIKSMPSKAVQQAAPATQKPVALIVDDSITMRVAAEHFLEEQGIESRMARDGIEALSMLQQQLPDVLLLDIDMPRLNGFELLQHLRQSSPNHRLPICMVSTRSGEVEREKARALGATHFIGKPYQAADLYEVLADMGIIKKQSNVS